MRAAFLLYLACAAVAQDAAPRDHRQARLAWDPSTLVLVQQGAVYGRMARLPDGRLLCSYERAGQSFVRHSGDEGATWGPPFPAAQFAYGTAANPEILVLHSGWLLLAYNERPTDRVHPYAIRVRTSMDGGESWSDPRLVYEAGTENGTGCWEPAMIQLDSGEVQLFFANEKPFPDTSEQEITLVRSFDEGNTWTEPERISLRAGFRDGMPVPLILPDGKGAVVAIEDNGLAGRFKPAILHTSIEENWREGVVDGSSPRRWAALETQLPDRVYAGAPYLRRFPAGVTVLSVQSAEGRARDNSLDYSRMVVYLGSAEARHFTNPSEPFSVPTDANGLWNSLFIKNETTVTAISGTTMFGVRGLWTIDGRLEWLEPRAARPAPTPLALLERRSR